jgi:Na+-translocating ferredoxin:NAD+ oxidoreductase RnfE subunit
MTKQKLITSWRTIKKTFVETHNDVVSNNFAYVTTLMMCRTNATRSEHKAMIIETITSLFVANAARINAVNSKIKDAIPKELTVRP